jgi:hypothetical protein
MRLPRLTSPRLLIAAAILLTQVGICAWQHFENTRYFAWAPNDYLVTYNLQVAVDGRTLTKEQIGHRYRLDLTGRLHADMKRKLGLAPSEQYVWEDPPQHLLNRIKWYEQNYGSGDHARVSLSYQLDGGPLREWRWPA